MVVKQDKRKKNQGRSGEIQTCEKKKIKKANTVYKSCWHGQDMRQKLLNTLCYTKSYLAHIKVLQLLSTFKSQTELKRSLLDRKSFKSNIKNVITNQQVND